MPFPLRMRQGTFLFIPVSETYSKNVHAKDTFCRASINFWEYLLCPTESDKTRYKTLVLHESHMVENSIVTFHVKGFGKHFLKI
jgi:hypothetical protein